MELADIDLIGYTFGAGSAVTAPDLQSIATSAVGTEIHLTLNWDWVHDQDIVQFEANIVVVGSGLPPARRFIAVPDSGLASLDFWPVSPHTNYGGSVRAINSFGEASAFSTFSQLSAGVGAPPSGGGPVTPYYHFTSQADVLAFDPTGILNTGDIIYVTIGGATHTRQLNSGAPSGTDWAVHGSGGSQAWAITGGTY